jgi:small-conductance mechanosensitive channel
MFERLAGVFIVVISTALVLMQFAIVRNVGVSLLASAGVAGVVIGFAAQKSLGTIVAGLQLSLTQPIRIGDSLVIEGEFGTIEQILLTYVVVRLWDDRRMVVPVTRFLDQPFQNWSKVTAQLTGAVTITCDFSTPVARAREELQRVVSESRLWDGRTCALQVTEANERSITLRALVSAANASAAWDLRCEVREKLIAFLCALDGGKHLPRVREEEVPVLAPGPS